MYIRLEGATWKLHNDLTQLCFSHNSEHVIFLFSGAQDEVVGLHLRSWGIICVLGHMCSSGMFTMEN